MKISSQLTSDHTRRELLAGSIRILQGSLLVSLTLALTPRSTDAQETQYLRDPDSRLTLELEHIAKQIEGKLIAPCCFTQTVANHYSNVADHMKQQIRQRLVAGVTEDQILDDYVRVYGERILSEPLVRGFNRLAYLLPLVTFVTGAGGVLLLLSRGKRTGLTNVTPAPLNGSVTEGVDKNLRARLADELARFEH